MNEDEFFLKVAHALAGCQLVEQELKLYISEALELVGKYVGQKLPFKMSGADYEDSSLEGLIRVFKKLTTNDLLVSELNEFKKERNYFSHKAIARSINPDGELDYLPEMESRIDAIKIEAERLREAIHSETNNNLRFLWFDDVSEVGSKDPDASVKE